ncbi:hypothetical protein AAE478_010012 [Parahypoxylon ruwenzoriense]
MSARSTPGLPVTRSNPFLALLLAASVTATARVSFEYTDDTQDTATGATRRRRVHTSFRLGLPRSRLSRALPAHVSSRLSQLPSGRISFTYSHDAEDTPGGVTTRRTIEVSLRLGSSSRLRRAPSVFISFTLIEDTEDDEDAPNGVNRRRRVRFSFSLSPTRRRSRSRITGSSETPALEGGADSTVAAGTSTTTEETQDEPGDGPP